MIDERSRFPLALLFALTLHVCALALVRVPPTAPEPNASRSLIVRLAAVAEHATAPATEPQAAAPAMSSAASEPAATEPDATESQVTEVAERSSREGVAGPSVAAPAPAPAPAPASPRDVPAQNAESRSAEPQSVESQRVDTAALDESTLAVPADRASKIAAEVRASYQDVLADWLRRHRDYPMHLRRRGVEGDGALRIRVDRGGNVALARMDSPITDDRLNELTIDMVRRAAPFPRMPDELEGQSFECVIDIRYRLTE